MGHYKLFLLLIPWLGTVASTDDCQQQNCPKTGHVLLPFINDCTKFVVCQNGLASIRSCREDFYFDNKMRACMPKTENSCKPCVVETSTQAPKPETPSRNQIVSLIRTVLTPFNDISEKCLQNSVTPVLCVPPLPDNRFLPHPDDCQLFYYCISAEIPPICRDCPDGMHFDPIERACAHPSVAKCQIPTKVSTNNLLNEAKAIKYTTPTLKVADTISLKCLRNSVTPMQCTAPIPRDNLLPHPDDCGLYYFCLSTDLPAICRDCPEGLHFHPLRHTCESPVTAGCLKLNSKNFTTTTQKPNVMVVTSVSSPRRNVSDKCRQNTKTPVMCTPELTEQSVFAHPDDCELYYHCPSTYLSPVCLDCPNGLHYNPAKHTCDVPAKAGCSLAYKQNAGTQGSESQIIHVTSSVSSQPNNVSDKCKQNSSTRVHCTSRNVLLPHPDSCELYYYCMSSNLPPQCRFCPNGLHFNPVERTCHDPSMAGCIKSNQTTLTSRGSHSGRELETVTSIPNQDAISEKCKQHSLTSMFCNSENSLLPHPHSCELYYYCVSANQPALCRDCPDGLHFNPVMRTCQNPTRAGCQTIAKPTTSPTFSVVTSVSVNTVHTVSLKCLRNPVTHIECHSRGLFPHPDSCELYYKCLSIGSPPLCEECPEGLYFDSTLRACGNANEVNCLLRNRHNQTDNTDNKIDTSYKCRLYGPSQTKCKAPLSQNSLLPHPEDCQLYYKCTSIDLPPICQECPNGQHFNPVKHTCDHIDRAGCQTKSAKLTELAEEESVICKSENGRYADLRPSGLDCNRYYVCDWGRVMTMSCPPLLHFNAKLKICDLPINAGCTLSGQGGQRQHRSRQKQVHCTVGYTPAGEFLPDPANCESFYQCDWSVPVKKECPSGLHFNPALKVCDFPEKANCRISHLRV